MGWDGCQRSTYLGVKHKALGGQAHVGLRLDQGIYDDSFPATCWAHQHGRVPGHHGLVHLHHFVLLPASPPVSQGFLPKDVEGVAIVGI